jgi:hypothetical protein
MADPGAVVEPAQAAIGRDYVPTGAIWRYKVVRGFERFTGPRPRLLVRTTPVVVE